MTNLRDTVQEMRKAQSIYEAARDKIVDVAPSLLRELRQGHDLTQKELAGILGIDHSYLSKIETGDVPMSKAILDCLYDLFYVDRTWDMIATQYRRQRKIVALAKALDLLFDEVPPPITSKEIDECLLSAGYDPAEVGRHMEEIARATLAERGKDHA